MADLAKLVVKLEAQSAQFQKELEQAKRKLKGFEGGVSGTLKKVAGGFAAVGAAAAVGLAALVRNAINAADNTRDMAMSVGVSVRSLSELTLAADLAGISQEELAKGLQKLARSAVDSAQGVKSAQDSWRALKISVTDSQGALKSQDELLGELADRFAAMPDGPIKTALAIDVLGKSGAKLIPLLNEGSKGIQAFREEAQRLGIVLDAETAAAADEFNDNLARLKFAVHGIGLRLAQALLPKLNELVEKFKDPEFQKKILETAEGLAYLAIQVARAGAAIGRLFAPDTNEEKLADLELRARGLRETIAKYENTEGFLKIFGNDVQGNVANMRKELAATDAQIQSLTHSIVQNAIGVKEAGAFGPDVQVPFRLPPVPGASNDEAFTPDIDTSAADEKKKKLDDLIASFKELEQNVGKTNDQIKLNEFAAAGASAEQQAWAAGILEANAQLEKQQQLEADLTASYERNAELITGVDDRTRQYNATLTELNELHARGILNDEQRAASVERLDKAFEESNEKAKDTADTMSTFADQAARNMQDAFADFLFDPFKDGLSGMVKSFAATLQRMVADALAAQLLKKLLGTTEGGELDLIGGLKAAASFFDFGGGMADGGMVTAGTPYLVGEQGMELFRPNVSGSIVANDELSGAGGMTQVFNITTPDASSFRASSRQIQRQARRALA